MKILYITSLSGNRINGFMRSAIIAAKQAGYEFDMACNTNDSNKEQYKQDCEEYGIRLHHIDFQRNPLHLKNYIAYKQLLKVMNSDNYDAVHCNTPVGGVLGRICAKKCGIKKIIYQAHGFHFWKGAPLKNWILYYPVEKCLSCSTDVLITINKEDYELANKKMYAKRVEDIPGVGIAYHRFADIKIDRKAKRCELGVPEDSILLLSVGELNENKNHAAALRALGEQRNPNIYYIIAGKGPLYEKLSKMTARYSIKNRVHLLGYRTDIEEIYKAADVFVFPSRREGLPGAVMEAMAAGLPIVAAKIRGVTDLLTDTDNPMVENSNDVEGYKKAFDLMASSSELRKIVGEANKQKAKEYDLLRIVEQMKTIYSELRNS